MLKLKFDSLEEESHQNGEEEDVEGKRNRKMMTTIQRGSYILFSFPWRGFKIENRSQLEINFPELSKMQHCSPMRRDILAALSEDKELEYVVQDSGFSKRTIYRARQEGSNFSQELKYKPGERTK